MSGRIVNTKGNVRNEDVLIVRFAKKLRPKLNLKKKIRDNITAPANIRPLGLQRTHRPRKKPPIDKLNLLSPIMNLFTKVNDNKK
jgi:hypothetical protein